jgi:hypothetical protein
MRIVKNNLGLATTAVDRTENISVEFCPQTVVEGALVSIRALDEFKINAFEIEFDHYETVANVAKTAENIMIAELVDAENIPFNKAEFAVNVVVVEYDEDEFEDEKFANFYPGDFVLLITKTTAGEEGRVAIRFDIIQTAGDDDEIVEVAFAIIGDTIYIPYFNEEGLIEYDDNVEKAEAATEAAEQKLANSGTSFKAPNNLDNVEVKYMSASGEFRLYIEKGDFADDEKVYVEYDPDDEMVWSVFEKVAGEIVIPDNAYDSEYEKALAARLAVRPLIINNVPGFLPTGSLLVEYDPVEEAFMMTATLRNSTWTDEVKVTMAGEIIDPMLHLLAAYAYLRAEYQMSIELVLNADILPPRDNEEAWVAAVVEKVQDFLDESDDFSDVKVTAIHDEPWGWGTANGRFELTLEYKEGHVGVNLPELRFYVSMDNEHPVLLDAFNAIVGATRTIIIPYLVEGYEDGLAMAKAAEDIAKEILDDNADYKGITARVHYGSYEEYEWFYLDLVMGVFDVWREIFVVEADAPYHELEEYLDPESGLEIDGEFLMGIEAGSGMEVGSLKDFFKGLPTGWTLVAYSWDDEELEEDAMVGTGTKLVLYNADGVEKDTITVVIMGDVTGTGSTNVGDIIALQNHILYGLGQGSASAVLTGEFFLAANLSAPFNSLHVGDLSEILSMALAQMP